MDKCMIQEIDILGGCHKLNTLACCCGHGKYKQTIVCKCRDGTIIETVSGIKLDRKKRFYRKDKDGFFFIPEVEWQR